MTLPSYAAADVNHYTRLKAVYAHRDRMHQMVHGVRQGHLSDLFPDELSFSLSFHGVPTANFIDNVARDMAETLAPLPSLACVSGKMTTDADLKRAELKNKIGSDYWRHCRLESQMLKGADWYVTYGFLPFFVEPDTDCSMPYIRVEEPRNAYYELDRFGNTRVYAKKWNRTIDSLVAQFPEYENQIRGTREQRRDSNGDTKLELVRWIDGTYVTLMLPQRDGVVLARYAHRMSRHPVHIAERPGEGEIPRGQFDDVVWVQVARAIMGTLALEAAALAVQAPIAVPSDMDEFPTGPHAILQSDNADKIHKVNLQLPPTIFAENQTLDAELKLGSRYPDVRTGGVQASVITGKGVEALMGTYDTQIKGGQMVLKEALQQATSRCFEMDEVWWPHESKTVSGTMAGASYEFSYTPAEQINGRWACTVTYGFAAGMHPSQSIVTMLQLEGAGLISRATTQENLPFDIDQVQEAKKISIEQSREALKQGLFSFVGAAGQMAAQGQDPTQTIKLAMTFIKNLEDGQPVEVALESAYEKQEQESQAQQQAEGPADQEPGGAPAGPGGEPAPPGQAGMPPGGMPTIEQMVAGFRGQGNTPVQSTEIRRRLPAGAP